MPVQKYSYLFGPVPSRRLGYSLGVDLFPTKVCNFNCPYCECGPTLRMPHEPEEFVPFDDVAAELRAFLPHHGLDFVTFSGNGEPTLYSRLGDLIRLIRTLCDTRVAVITNSSLMARPDVRDELALADVVLPSLDAVSQEVMRRINRPYKTVRADEMIEGLVRFREQFRGEIRLEILFCRGLNDSPEEIGLLAEAARRIRPDRVQLNTVDRPPADDRARPLTRGELEKILERFTGVEAEVIGAFRKDRIESAASSAEGQIIALIGRRGVNEDDLFKSLGIPREEAEKILGALVREGRIRRTVFEGRVHYIGKTAE